MMQKSVGESFISVDSQPPLLQDGLFTPRITPMSSPTVPTSSFRLSPLYSDSSTPTRPRPGLPSSCRTSNAEGSVPVFTCHLKVFLGRRDMRELVIIEDWDDEQILQLLRSTYDEMRGTWRKRLSAKRISEVWLIKHIQGYGCEKSNDSFESPDVYDIPTFMDTPSLQQGKYALKKYLAKICEARDTVQLGVNRDRDAGYELGLKFVESWQAVLIVGAGLLVVVLSTLIVVVCYWIYRRDLSTAFTIAGCIGGLFTILLGLVQLLITVRS
ncbi:hypothetical protein NEOLEDRAFT_890944 [Neolentinus lepideus HHB14362 ss-1]|uniref:Transmembrane protein n=1 Tax=Neolentinus lepideus HHB14362 ss-1 TaxID=1314782 RepID=A0A165NVM8_9AGAM|nr:hypothetical protein NEOLEDRAFT_890944 [Neolentinus lepideus HHB14362 ss-1]